MAGFYPQGNVHTENWLINVRARDVLGLKEAASRLTSSVNVMIARHPLARFVSAFRDKFADGRRLDKPQSHEHYTSNGTVPRPREGVGPSDDLLTLDPNLLQYYLQLPPHLKAQVIHYYALDLKLLGFQVPPVLTSFTTS
ncbi:hypothetical protein Pcinc_009826 [Petrolisthes cinctipes]|uniref:Carbohydrate sulfotransferase n=1 Tax=Petrolisthes cinctipes TaxID=88211 RepID=A0AAE1KV35_PETCI|nr:hypothetical protein Pcinc_009826 [Petrolisthes cinctipes]